MTSERREPLGWFKLDPTALGCDEATGGLGFAELGLHLALVAESWRNDGLPDDPATLLSIRARGAREFKRLWPRVMHLWPSDAQGRRRCSWLEDRRRESEDYRATKSRNRRGGQRSIDDSATADQRPSTLGQRPIDGAALQTDRAEQSPQSPADQSQQTPAGAVASLRGVGSDGEAPAGAAGGDQLAPILASTSWRSHSPDRPVLVLRLARRLETEGMTVADLRRLWSLARRNSKVSPGGLFDSYLESEDSWRRALAQAEQLGVAS